MSPVERQVRKLVRAWPIPDRVERGEEIVATTLDLVPDDRNHLAFAMALNLVVGGLRARWRMRPPPWRWIYYRMSGRLNARWHRWMLNDVSGPGWRRRIVASQVILSVAPAILGVLAGSSLATHRLGSGISFLVYFVSAMIVMQVVTYNVRARKLRDKQLARYGFLQSAQRFPTGHPPSPSQPGGPHDAGVSSPPMG